MSQWGVGVRGPDRDGQGASPERGEASRGPFRRISASCNSPLRSQPGHVISRGPWHDFCQRSHHASPARRSPFPGRDIPPDRHSMTWPAPRPVAHSTRLEGRALGGPVGGGLPHATLQSQHEHRAVGSNNTPSTHPRSAKNSANHPHGKTKWAKPSLLPALHHAITPRGDASCLASGGEPARVCGRHEPAGSVISR